MRKANLMLHCGAAAVSREQLIGVRTPDRTKTWVPVPHARLLDTVQDTLAQQGLTVVSEAHGLTQDGARYFGLLQVQDGHDDGDFGLVVGVRNSHDKSFPAALALGAQVLVCDNLSFRGEVKLSRKHTAYIERDLPGLVSRAVGMLGALRRTQEERFDAYKRTEITDAQAHDLIIRAMDVGALPVTRIPAAIDQWRRPHHLDFVEGGRTVWRLWNAWTEVLKGNLTMLPKRTQAIHSLADGACGLLAPTLYQTADAEIQATVAA
jgi:hypothetical protein